MDIPHFSFKISTLVLVLLLSSCVDPIELDIDRQAGQLVIEGEITNGTERHLIRVSRSTEKAQVTLPEPGATIVLFDNQGNQESLVEEEPGHYWHNSNVVKGEKGGTYHLEVTLSTGAVYHSIPETMPTENAVQEVYYENNFITSLNLNDRPFSEWRVQLFNNVTIPETEHPLYLRWTMHEVYRITQTSATGVLVCYPRIYSKTHNFQLYNGEELSANRIDNQFINDRTVEHFSFQEKHYFNVVQASLSKEAFAYWERIDEVLNSAGSIFDTPPAAIIGNMYNINDPTEKVLGYFEASARDTVRTFTLPGNLPPSISLIFLSCNCNCLALPFTTQERPYYF